MIPELPFALEPGGHPPCEYQLTDGSLILRSAARTDLFLDPAGDGKEPPGAGWLTGIPPEGDFMLSARVTVDFASTFDAGVLLVHADDQHWAKLCFEYSPQHKPTAVTVVTRETSDDCNSFEVEGNELGLRITRTGRAWALHASEDGHWWRLLRYFALADHGRAADTEVRIGFLAQSPTGSGCTATFTRIAWHPAAPADLRDGT
jgi:regulation of enolase protein 1 (concanavalin A-like superfamily)